MSDDTRPLPEQPAPTGSGDGTPPTGPNRQARMFGWIAILLFLAVGIGAFALSQMGNDNGRDDNEAASTSTEAPDTTEAPSTTAPTPDEEPDEAPDVDTTTTTVADAPSRHSLFVTRNEDGTVILAGSLPSMAVSERAISGVERAFGAEIVDETTIDGGAEPEWFRELVRNLRYLDRVEEPLLDVQHSTEGVVTISGFVASDRDRIRTLERFEEALPGFTFEDQLVVGGSRSEDAEAAAARDALRTAAREIRDANVLFATGSADISAEGSDFLTGIAEILEEFPSVEVQVEGHTDSQGTEEFNEQLSQDRSESVVAFLVEAGIDESRLVARGYGERRPVADNDTDEGRAQNRRIEFTITDR